jgi:hypothetical protein
MIDHAVVKATPALFSATVKFYELALQPLGHKKLREMPNQAAGFGDAMPGFWVFGNGKDEGSAHVALRAKGKSSCQLHNFSRECWNLKNILLQNTADLIRPRGS